MASTSAELFEAIEADDADRVRALLADDPSLASARDEQGVSALMRARYRFDKGVIEAVFAAARRSTCSRRRRSATWTGSPSC